MSSGFFYSVSEEAQRQIDRLIVGVKTSYISISGLEATLLRLRQDRARVGRDLRVIDADILRVTELLEASKSETASPPPDSTDCPA